MDIKYQLNERDEIVSVNEAWDAFALANDGTHLAASDVLGLPLWGFIVDETTRQLYQRLLARVRNSGEPAGFRLRCDSPECRRLLEVRVVPTGGGGAEFSTRTVSEERRPRQPLLDVRTPRSRELLLVCSWCGQVSVDSHWVEVEEALARLNLFERPVLPALTHGICQACHELMVGMLGREGRQR